MYLASTVVFVMKLIVVGPSSSLDARDVPIRHELVKVISLMTQICRVK